MRSRLGKSKGGLSSYGSTDEEQQEIARKLETKKADNGKITLGDLMKLGTRQRKIT